MRTVRYLPRPDLEIPRRTTTSQTRSSSATLLDHLDIRLARSRGSGEVEITLIKGDLEVPSNDPKDVVVQWTRKLTAPRSALEVLTLVPDSDVTLGPQEAYWVRIAACGEDSAI